MTDKELLMMAAKAVGFNVKAVSVDIDDNFNGLVVGAKNTKQKVRWNPLANDGDALRLAVKLRMDINVSHRINEVIVYTITDKIGRTDEKWSFDIDEYAATRRAIVRAAAAIGGDL